MEPARLYIASSPALDYAKVFLKKYGLSIADRIEENVSHILLPIPAGEIPEGLPEKATLIGGHIPRGIDLLKDEVYLAQNAAITAHGAVKIAMNVLPVCLWDCDTLILGWGRIAQCLAHLLKGMGGKVSIAARKESAVALAGALGFDAFPLESLNFAPYRLVFNTIPAQLGLKASDFPPDCVQIDLASTKALPGEDVIWARGLPGKEAPESSGALIARRTAYYLIKE